MTPFAAIVLAAGKSTRMHTAKPKALHAVAGRPMLVHILNALESAGAARIIVVVGHGADQIRAEIGESRVDFVEQTEQRGTGHATLMAREALADWTGPVLVLPGDAPLITPDVIEALLEGHGSNAATLLSVELDRPGSYGRILRNAAGSVIGIVEEKDATPEQKMICEVNVSMYAFDALFLFPALSSISPENAQGEYYLTDTIAIARSQNRPVGALRWPDPNIGRGVNTRVELAEIDALFHARILRRHMLSGVTIVDPMTTRIEAEVKIGVDTVVWPSTILRGVTDIGDGCEIGPGARIDDARIGDRCRVWDSWVVASEVSADTSVGPYANIRPNSTIGAHVKVGNFVEVKASTLEDGVKVGHLTYLGDSTVGEDTNIGAGTITCNYDGYKKHRTVIGKRSFIGSNSTLVAPVSIGDQAFVAGGSTITDEVGAGALGIGRARQVNKEDWASRWREANDKPDAGETTPAASIEAAGQ